MIARNGQQPAEAVGQTFAERVSFMLKRVLKTGYAWLLAAFFAVGAFANLLASQQTREDYQSWGYPGWFHYVTGLLEATAAVLLALSATRLAGSLLGAAVMASAAATLLIHAEYSHALAPLTVLVLVGINAWLAWRERP